MDAQERAERIAVLPEVELMGLVVAVLEQRGFVVHREQRVGSRRWDLVAYGPKNRTMLVEIARSLTSARASSIVNVVGELERGQRVLVVVTAGTRAGRALLGRRPALFELWDSERLAELVEQYPGVAATYGLADHVARGPALGFLRSLTLRNVRGFEDLHFDLGEHGEDRVIIGRNGTGKSTLLRIIALVLASFHEMSAMLAQPIGDLIRQGRREAEIEATVVSEQDGTRELKLVLERVGGEVGIADRSEASGPFESVFVCGYGVGRNITGGGQPSPYQVGDAVASLFNYATALVDPELVLRRLRDELGTERYAQALAGLLRVIGLDSRHELFIPRGGGVHVAGPSIATGSIALAGWADGYRMTFQWLIDLFGWALQANAIDSEGHIHGVLLIDELEQHLHPSMQTALLGELSELLPHVQLIATTHSPLVALGSDAHHIISLQHDGERVCSVRVPELIGYSAEDVLVERSLFGTDPHSPSTRELIDEQQRLGRIPKTKRSARQRARLRELARQLEHAASPELRDDPVLQRLDTLQRLLTSERAGK